MLPPHPFEDPTRLEADIAAFEAQDAVSPPPENPIVFVGSSSFRLWSEVEDDFAPLPVINRGFGGSFLSESVYYADRIIVPYNPRAVVVYAGENDIGNGRTGQQVFEQFHLLVEKLRESCPDAEIFSVSIKPSPGRGPAIEQIRIANNLIQAWTEDAHHVHFIDVGTPMLGGDGFGRAEFFVEDGVHMKRSGYELWKEVIQPCLQPLFP